MEKIYHIYVKGECKYHSLDEENFKNIWANLRNLSWVSEVNEDELDYEELIINREVALNSSH